MWEEASPQVGKLSQLHIVHCSVRFHQDLGFCRFHSHPGWGWGGAFSLPFSRGRSGNQPSLSMLLCQPQGRSLTRITTSQSSTRPAPGPGLEGERRHGLSRLEKQERGGCPGPLVGAATWKQEERADPGRTSLQTWPLQTPGRPWGSRLSAVHLGRRKASAINASGPSQQACTLKISLYFYPLFKFLQLSFCAQFILPDSVALFSVPEICPTNCCLGTTGLPVPSALNTLPQTLPGGSEEPAL